MKSVLISITLHLCTSIIAQNISGVISYKFTRPAPVEIRSTQAYLYFNNEKSLFDYDKILYMTKEDSIELAVNKHKQVKRDTYGQMYFTDKNSGMLYFREFIYRKPYISQEKIPVIAWQLKNEVKTIAGYVCKKAIAEFRGRKYTAWYTSLIPVSVGPWKLQGLPGAILEAKSEDGYVSFEAESIRIPADVQKELLFTQLPDGKMVSYPEEYRKAIKNEHERASQEGDALILTIIDLAKKEGKISKDVKVGKSTLVPMFTIEKYE